jgi:ribosomal-protein-alanine N-acetyltransferase
MTIREMTADDIDRITVLDKQAFSKPWSAQTFAEELQKDYSYYLTAETENEIIAYAGIWCIYEVAELIRIAVSPSFRRQHVADALMDVILNKAAECGCEKMMLEVRESNCSAYELYLKHGFVQTSVRRGYYDGTENAVIMEHTII